MYGGVGVADDDDDQPTSYEYESLAFNWSSWFMQRSVPFEPNEEKNQKPNILCTYKLNNSPHCSNYDRSFNGVAVSFATASRCFNSIQSSVDMQIVGMRA